MREPLVSITRSRKRLKGRRARGGMVARDVVPSAKFDQSIVSFAV
jgi:hypothetical protein